MNFIVMDKDIGYSGKMGKVTGSWMECIDWSSYRDYKEELSMLRDSADTVMKKISNKSVSEAIGIIKDFYDSFYIDGDIQGRYIFDKLIFAEDGVSVEGFLNDGNIYVISFTYGWDNEIAMAYQA